MNKNYNIYEVLKLYAAGDHRNLDYNPAFVKMMQRGIPNSANKPPTVDLTINFKMLAIIFIAIIITCYIYKC
uniref:Uncharacterized protein n=1 Tax=Strongyloides stercoralis TaxID=6248 RepID=A0A0K0E4X8_STRER